MNIRIERPPLTGRRGSLLRPRGVNYEDVVDRLGTELAEKSRHGPAIRALNEMNRAQGRA